MFYARLGVLYYDLFFINIKNNSLIFNLIIKYYLLILMNKIY